MKWQEYIAKLPDTLRQIQERILDVWRLQGARLELYLPTGWPENGAPVSWWLGSAAGEDQKGQVTDLQQLPHEAKAAAAHVWSSPGDTLLTTATVPTRARAKIQQALPYVLEELLLGEPEKQHFAYRLQADGPLAVAVTARDRLQTWLQALNAVGLQTTSLSPAILALPQSDDSWTLAFVNGETWLRTGPAAGFTCAGAGPTPPLAISAAVREARAKEQAPKNLIVIRPPRDFDEKAWAESLELTILPDDRDLWSLRSPPATALNLLQGDFAPAGQTRQLVQALQPAAILISIWLVGNLAFGFWEWRHLGNEHQAARKEMMELFQRTFPDAKVVVDPALQMQRMLSDMRQRSGQGGADDFLAMLVNLAPVIQANPQAKLRGVQYSDMSLTLELGLPDYQAMDGLKNSFTARGIRVEVLSANSSASGVVGRLRISNNAKSGAAPS